MRVIKCGYCGAEVKLRKDSLGIEKVVTKLAPPYAACGINPPDDPMDLMSSTETLWTCDHFLESKNLELR
jgi:hypothetical protein